MPPPPPPPRVPKTPLSPCNHCSPRSADASRHHSYLMLSLNTTAGRTTSENNLLKGCREVGHSGQSDGRCSRPFEGSSFRSAMWDLTSIATVLPRTPSSPAGPFMGPLVGALHVPQQESYSGCDGARGPATPLFVSIRAGGGGVLGNRTT